MRPCSTTEQPVIAEPSRESLDRSHRLEVSEMVLELAVAFFVLAIIAGVFGQQGIAGMSMEIAKWLIIAFIVLAIISFLL